MVRSNWIFKFIGKYVIRHYRYEQPCDHSIDSPKLISDIELDNVDALCEFLFLSIMQLKKQAANTTGQQISSKTINKENIPDELVKSDGYIKLIERLSKLIADENLLRRPLVDANGEYPRESQKRIRLDSIPSHNYTVPISI